MEASQKLANLRNKFELFDSLDVTVDEFVVLYNSLARILFAEEDAGITADYK